MTTRRSLLQIAALTPVLACCSTPADPLLAAADRIRPLFSRKTPPQPGEWLAEHKEPGQTYAEFRAQKRARAIDAYSTMRIVPIGPLSGGQQSVLDVTCDFMKAFFGLPLAIDPTVPLESIPADAQRNHFQISENGDFSGNQQLLSTHLLNEVLRARRKPDDAAVLGITAMDLWPGAGWNFVFGQASLGERVGVWSMARNGDPDDSESLRRICTMRTVQTATHETGHMFGIRHCIAYQCGMNGSNHADERDRQPLEFCPECQPKVWWTLGLDPLTRSRALEATSRRHGLQWAADAFAMQSRALSRTRTA